METGANMLWFAMAFTLVVSALVARRLPMKDWLKMALAGRQSLRWPFWSSRRGSS